MQDERFSPVFAVLLPAFYQFNIRLISMPSRKLHLHIIGFAHRVRENGNSIGPHPHSPRLKVSNIGPCLSIKFLQFDGLTSLKTIYLITLRGGRLSPQKHVTIKNFKTIRDLGIPGRGIYILLEDCNHYQQVYKKLKRGGSRRGCLPVNDVTIK